MPFATKLSAAAEKVPQWQLVATPTEGARSHSRIMMITQESTTLGAKSTAEIERSGLPPIFPLGLTPFEYFFLCDDRPGYRGIIPIEVIATGKLDKETLDRAFRITQERHPLLTARIEEGRDGWPCWIPGEPESVVFAQGRGEWQNIAFSTAGVQLRVRDGGHQISLLFAFRHVAVDGLGAFQFISDLFVAYEHFSAGKIGPPPWRPLDSAKLCDRDRHQLFRQNWKLSDVWRILRVHLPLSIRPAALVSEEKLASAADSLVASLPTEFQVEYLTDEESAALAQVATKQGVMLNDLLLRDFFLMLAAWNCGTPQERGPLRVMIPINMRGRESLRMSATNAFSYAFITQYGSSCHDRAQLLEAVSREMARIKREKLGLHYEAGLRLLCRFPRFVRWSLKRKWAFATAVFTNLGSAFDQVPLPTAGGHKFAGELILETGAGAGPIRPETRISFSAHAYAGRLSIGARCDPHCFTPVQQTALLASYVAHLRKTIDLQS